MPYWQDNRGDRLPEIKEEVDQRCLHHGRHRGELHALQVDDVEKFVNDRLQDLRIGGDSEDALSKETDQVNSSPFTSEIEHAAPLKRFSTLSFTGF